MVVQSTIFCDLENPGCQFCLASVPKGTDLVVYGHQHVNGELFSIRLRDVLSKGDKLDQMGQESIDQCFK